MKYRIHRMNNRLWLECIDGGVGSAGPRPVRCSQGISAFHLLDRLWMRGHCTYKLLYQGDPVLEKDFAELVLEDDFSESKLEIVVSSAHDILRLLGHAWNCLEYPQDLGPQQNQQRYKRPTSRKAVKASWIYQNGTDAVTAEATP